MVQELTDQDKENIKVCGQFAHTIVSLNAIKNKVSYLATDVFDNKYLRGQLLWIEAVIKDTIEEMNHKLEEK